MLLKKVKRLEIAIDIFCDHWTTYEDELLTAQEVCIYFYEPTLQLN